MREGGPGESGITSLPRMAHVLSLVMFPTAVWLDLIILIFTGKRTGNQRGKVT